MKLIERVVGLGLIFVASISGLGQAVNKDLIDLAATERAFAAKAVKDRWQVAFIAYFADDGIGFGPHPERTKQVLQSRSMPTTPRTVVFNWAPMFGDISLAGDLGYTTGPVLFTDLSQNPKPPWHGAYFSVWQKQADHSWKVVVDMGVDVPSPVAPIDTSFTPAKAVRTVRKDKMPVITDQQLVDLDNSFSKFIRENGMAKAYAKFLERRQFRIHRNSMMPILNENELVPVLSPADSFEFIGGKISKSNDLAFTYGKYVSAAGDPDLETGYYVHVWRRGESGEFKLVVDVKNPLPKPQASGGVIE